MHRNSSNLSKPLSTFEITEESVLHFLLSSFDDVGEDINLLFHNDVKPSVMQTQKGLSVFLSTLYSVVCLIHCHIFIRIYLHMYLQFVTFFLFSRVLERGTLWTKIQECDCIHSQIEWMQCFGSKLVPIDLFKCTYNKNPEGIHDINKKVYIIFSESQVFKSEWITTYYIFISDCCCWRSLLSLQRSVTRSKWYIGSKDHWGFWCFWICKHLLGLLDPSSKGECLFL